MEKERKQRKRESTRRFLRANIRHRRTICVFAPMFSRSGPADGYIQRIRLVDKRLLKGFLRIYLMGDCPELEAESVQWIDPNHVFIRFDSADQEQLDWVFDLISAAGRTYIHSAYRFIAGYVAPELRQILTLPGVKHIWDVHGAVPEEIELNGDLPLAEIAEKVEEELYRTAKIMVTVSRAMEDYLTEKYGAFSGNSFVLPMMEPHADSPTFTPRPMPGGKPVVLYSGGLQSWQNVPAMLDLISATADRYEYRLFVSDVGELRSLWGDRPGWEKVTAGTRTPAEMEREYAAAHYGLLLRDDIPVNRVSCPTKLMEYISHGVVPVLRSPEIGDFAAMGLCWVSEEDLINGTLPAAGKREEMAQSNRSILGRMSDKQRKTEADLRFVMV